ncbi:MAG: GNAT family N-acetyltransferase [Anaerolineaceae bacterium]
MINSVMDYFLRDTPYLRQLNLHRDLNGVADLIEICFSTHMDGDGKEYLRRIRETARNQNSFWSLFTIEQVNLPLNGLVWEEDGKLIGNLTLIPFFRERALNYLIANVAVHPEHRRKGIARRLTEKALEYIEEQGAYSAWLQVREDNPPALNLYRSLAFQEKARRTSWESGKDLDPHPFNRNLQIQKRVDLDWNLQSRWLKEAYPPEVSWNLPIEFNRFTPGLWASLGRFLNGQDLRHWSARFQNRLVGLATWEAGSFYNDFVWLAVPPEWDRAAIPALLEEMKREIFIRRPWQLNYPAGRAEDVFQEMGFNKQNTLIWMQKIIGKIRI